MAWVVDTCVLLDIRHSSADFGASSAKSLEDHHQDGLVIAPITYVELAPEFRGNENLQNLFLEEIGVDWVTSWERRDTKRACRLWTDYIEKRRKSGGNKRPVADVLIEAFASRFQGLITRNASHFTSVPIVVP